MSGLNDSPQTGASQGSQDVQNPSSLSGSHALQQDAHEHSAGEKDVRVAVDFMGGDRAPQVVEEGVRRLLASTNSDDTSIRLVLTGAEAALAPLAREFPERVRAVPTTEVIAMDEHPATAVKQKKDSSIVVGCKLVKEGRADAFFSAGSTGGVMAAATLIIGRVRGVKRPAIATVVPAPGGKVLLLDAGANTDVSAEYLAQFAAMGEIFAREVMGVAKPRVGLLNVGSEDTKGSQLAQDAYALLRERGAGFVGNAEGSDLFKGSFDVVVTDGFTGNIVLKTMEGLVSGLFGELKSIFYASLKNKLAAAAIKNDLAGLKKQLDVEAIGGAPLLGLQAPVIIGHGSSSALAIESGIRATAAAIRQDVPGRIRDALASSSARPLGSAEALGNAGTSRTAGSLGAEALDAEALGNAQSLSGAGTPGHTGA